ncbi:hypothetical protein NQZ68_010833, partial [Dissostichus eleginoides]
NQLKVNKAEPPGPSLRCPVIFGSLPEKPHINALAVVEWPTPNPPKNVVEYEVKLKQKAAHKL